MSKAGSFVDAGFRQPRGISEKTELIRAIFSSQEVKALAAKQESTVQDLNQPKNRVCVCATRSRRFDKKSREFPAMSMVIKQDFNRFQHMKCRVSTQCQYLFGRLGCYLQWISEIMLNSGSVSHIVWGVEAHLLPRLNSCMFTYSQHSIEYSMFSSGVRKPCGLVTMSLICLYSTQSKRNLCLLKQQ